MSFVYSQIQIQTRISSKPIIKLKFSLIAIWNVICKPMSTLNKTISKIQHFQISSLIFFFSFGVRNLQVFSVAFRSHRLLLLDWVVALLSGKDDWGIELRHFNKTVRNYFNWLKWVHCVVFLNSRDLMSRNFMSRHWTHLILNRISANHFWLIFQLLLLVIFCVLGTLTFCWVEWLTHRDAILAASNEPEPANEEQVRIEIS